MILFELTCSVLQKNQQTWSKPVVKSLNSRAKVLLQLQISVMTRNLLSVVPQELFLAKIIHSLFAATVKLFSIASPLDLSRGKRVALILFLSQFNYSKSKIWQDTVDPEECVLYESRNIFLHNLKRVRNDLANIQTVLQTRDKSASKYIKCYQLIFFVNFDMNAKDFRNPGIFMYVQP